MRAPPPPPPTWTERLARRFRPPRRVLPTRAGGITLLMPLILGVAAINAGNNLLFILVGACLGMITLSGIVSEQLVRTIDVEVRPSGPQYAGEPGRLSVRVYRPRASALLFDVRVRERVPRRSRKTRPAAEVLDARLAFLEGLEAVAPATRVFPRRGVWALGPLELLTRYPFGLLTKACDLRAELEVLVRPRRVPVPAALVDPRAVVPEGLAAQRRGRGDDFYGLRERDDRDVDARVHALRSLRLGREVVVDTEATARPVAWVGVSAAPGAEPEALERALELAQATLEAWELQGWAVGLAVGAVELGPERAALGTLLDVLATVEPGTGPVTLDARAVWLVPTGAEVEVRAEVVVIDVRADGTATPRARRAAA